MLERVVREAFADASVGACMAQHGKIIVSQNADALFPVYSLTKTYIACLCLIAEREGLLNLRDTLSEYLNEIPDGGRIQLHQLLNHTAGIPDYGALPSYHRAIRNGETPWSDEMFAAQTYENGLLFKPGSRFHYSNPGYALLVRILQQVYAEDFSVILHRTIVTPLGLSQTQVLTTLDRTDIASAHSAQLTADGRQVAVAQNYPVGWVWHRLIGASAFDVCTFLSAVFEGQLLRQAEIGQLTRTVSVEQPNSLWQSPAYGLGVMHDREGEFGAAFGHNGDGPGCCCSGFYFLAQHCAVAVIANVENSDRSFATVLRLYREKADAA